MIRHGTRIEGLTEINNQGGKSLPCEASKDCLDHVGLRYVKLRQVEIPRPFLLCSAATPLPEESTPHV
jgi:hypothetical protein